MTKEGLAQTTSDITENLMSISRMMAQQVQQSEETITSLGWWMNSILLFWYTCLILNGIKAFLFTESNLTGYTVLMHTLGI